MICTSCANALTFGSVTITLVAHQTPMPTGTVWVAGSNLFFARRRILSDSQGYLPKQSDPRSAVVQKLFYIENKCAMTMGMTDALCFYDNDDVSVCSVYLLQETPRSGWDVEVRLSSSSSLRQRHASTDSCKMWQNPDHLLLQAVSASLRDADMHCHGSKQLVAGFPPIVWLPLIIKEIDKKDWSNH